MASTKKSADSFGTFLESLRRDAGARADDPGLRLLTVLGETGPTSRAELFTKSELDVVSFAAGYEAVKASGFVRSLGAPGDEVLELTGSGREVLSSPA